LSRPKRSRNEAVEPYEEEEEITLSYLQELSSGTHPVSLESSPCLNNLLISEIFQYPPCLGPPSGLLPSDSATKMCDAFYMAIQSMPFDFITLIFGNEHKL
jgi:hypothetical protein